MRVFAVYDSGLLQPVESIGCTNLKWCGAEHLRGGPEQQPQELENRSGAQHGEMPREAREYVNLSNHLTN